MCVWNPPGDNQIMKTIVNDENNRHQILRWMEQRKRKIMLIIAILFLCRILFLTLIPPYVGIANNGDFQRLSCAVGINYREDPWKAENYDKYFFEYITNDYIFIKPIESSWNQIFEVFPQLAIMLSNRIEGERFDLRYMGFINAIFYFASLSILLAYISRIQSKYSWFLFIIALLVLCDCYILQYFNCFYTEIGSISGIIALWGLYLIGVRDGNNFRTLKTSGYLLLLFVVSLFAIHSKQQDVLLVFPVVILSWILMKRMNIKNLFCIIWIILLLGSTYKIYTINEGSGNNTTYNVIMMDILHYSNMPEEHLKNTLGIPENRLDEYMEAIGKNPFSNGIDRNEFLDHFTRKNEIVIILQEPQIIFKMIAARSKSLFLDTHLGNYTAESGAKPYEKSNENRAWYHFKASVYPRSIFFYLAVIYLAVVVGIVGLAYKGKRKIDQFYFYLLLFLPISNLLRFVTIIVGDSSHDDSKHFFATNVEFDVILLCLGLLLIYVIQQAIQKFIQRKHLIGRRKTQCIR